MDEIIEFCGTCDGEVKMMTRKGTGYCSEKCFDVGEGQVTGSLTRVKEYDAELREQLKQRSRKHTDADGIWNG